MKKICLVNGSLRGRKSSSLVFLENISARLPLSSYNIARVTVNAKVKGSYPEDMLKSIAQSDAVILVFPLFAYGLPGALMKLLEDFARYKESRCSISNQTRVYAVVNCGFPRPVINIEAVRVIKNFCRRLNLGWRFAVCIGTGPVVAATSRIPLLGRRLNKAFSAIVEDFGREDKPGGSQDFRKNDYFIKPVLPEPVILAIKRQYEKKMR